MYGEPGEEYYYVDEEGNLIEPGGDEEGGASVPAEDERLPDPDPRLPAPSAPSRATPPAASDEFLERATGREMGAEAPRRAPQPQGTIRLQRGGQPSGAQ